MTPSVDCLHVGKMWSNLFRALSPVSQSSSCSRITRMGLTSWRGGVTTIVKLHLSAPHNRNLYETLE